MSTSTGLYRGYRYPPEVIAHAVRLYLRFALSFRDAEELLAERGIAVTYETVRQWVAKFGTSYADELRKRELRAGRTWHVDEAATRAGGRLHWLWRAVDEPGQTLDLRLQTQRDTAAAARFFRRLLAGAGGVPPERVTPDELGSYAAALARVPEMHAVEHLQARSARRCNNRGEQPGGTTGGNNRGDQAHQPTRLRERVMRRFKSPASAQRFLDAFSRVGDLFRPRRHRLTAAAYRATLRERVATWRAVAGLRPAQRYRPACGVDWSRPRTAC